MYKNVNGKYLSYKIIINQVTDKFRKL